MQAEKTRQRSNGPGGWIYQARVARCAPTLAQNDYSIIINDGGLAASGNTALNAILFNTNYITQVAVTPSTLSAADAKAAALAVPEPATATLSLLALAGLAARRRRH